MLRATIQTYIVKSTLRLTTVLLTTKNFSTQLKLLNRIVIIYFGEKLTVEFLDPDNIDMISKYSTKVSILVAARNEAANIQNCIEALIDQKYPPSYFDIWIGDDNSNDDTAKIVKNLQPHFQNLHLLEVKESRNGLIGKPNVLAQLARKAEGEFFLITDADVYVPDSWINAFVEEFTDSVDLLSGVVALRGHNLFAQLQNADWISYMAKCYDSSKKGKPVTALGGNMAIRATAYKKIGGYENIPFSVTEDYELFRALTDAGHGFKTLFQENVLAFTNPVNTFKDLLKQRRRWVTSSFRRNWFSNVEFDMNSLYLPALIAVAVIFPPIIAVGLFLIKWIVDFISLKSSFNKLRIKINAGVILHSPYAMVCNFIFLYFIFFKAPIEWKGRIYKSPSSN